MIDLHCHSTASDGILPPREVVRTAAGLGLSAIALTDHDTTDGVPEAVAAGEEFGVRVVAACEFSVGVRWGEMHLLGYFLPVGEPTLEEFLTFARAGRERRAREMVNRLVRLGVRITYDDVLAAAGGGAVGRPHVARALMLRGHVRTIQQAFDRYIGTGRAAFVDKELPPLRTVATLVHALGGILSAAHLKQYGTVSELTLLRDDGLDAVETRHPSHDGETRAVITEAAIALGLGRSGGSDWHGESDPSVSHSRLGSQEVPDEWLDALDNLRRRVPA